MKNMAIELLARSVLNTTLVLRRLKTRRKSGPVFHRAILLLRLLILLAFWQAAYYSSIIPSRFSHPKAIIHQLLNVPFLTGFILTLIQVAIASLIGGLMGIGLGVFLSRYEEVSYAAIRIFKLLLWIPLIVAWSLPLPPDDVKKVIESVTSIQVITIFLFSCYSYLAQCFLLKHSWAQARGKIFRSSIIHGLLVAVISQLWYGPYGWRFFWLGQEQTARIYAAVVLTFLVVAIINDSFHYSFEDDVIETGEILTRLIKIKCRLPGIILLLFIAMGLTWQFWNLAEGFGALNRETNTFFNFSISISEIIGGLIIAGAMITLLSELTARKPGLRHLVSSILPQTIIVPIFLPLWLMGIFGERPIIWTSIAAGALGFVPLMVAYTGTHDMRSITRVLLAIDNALPFAFVAMIFGEVINSTAGLGFSMRVAIALDNPEGALGIAIIICAMFILISMLLRTVAKATFLQSCADARL
jgi:ABC-type nitrate/sulfonate/bicarbonate transport system permease component